MAHLIKVELKIDRTKSGKLFYEEKEAVCLGKSDNKLSAKKHNPTRNPIWPYGDFPTGLYEIMNVEPVGTERRRSYGPWKIRVKPLLGQCLVAYDLNHGRTGILVHGGDTSDSSRYDEGLRPSCGCLRILNDSLVELVAYLQSVKNRVYVYAKESP